jgi:hypothetical protein
MYLDILGNNGELICDDGGAKRVGSLWTMDDAKLPSGSPWQRELIMNTK